MLNRIVISLILSLGCSAYAQQPSFVIDGRGQGTTYHLKYYAERSMITREQIDSILAKIDDSMSLYKESSIISKFNGTAQGMVTMDAHMQKVIKRSFAISKESRGIFDITVQPLVSLWGFGPKRVTKMPSQPTIDSVLQYVGMEKLALHGNTLKKKTPGIRIDLNGIAQGYTVDVLADFLASNNIKNYIVELGGEIRAKGHKEKGAPFEIGIERPVGAEQNSFRLQLTDRAITTSGNYRHSFDKEGIKVHHHLSPFTGYPLQNNVASVTVIADTAMDADGYDNVFMALPPHEGIALANRLKGIEVYIIYKDEKGYKEVFSKGFSRYIKT
ncbi:FAD:protein FMN transferase [Sphingobacterium sp. JB170]|uniref:FAD:protein FMN transferase n=1 Tax=Sphingobacterium sp. JB170 TaxID=1434842 RepID=UPI00211B099D|nr:FAD:protein FMN transferase [Sphingobacterium sp. JB170]